MFEIHLFHLSVIVWQIVETRSDFGLRHPNYVDTQLVVVGVMREAWHAPHDNGLKIY